MTIDWTVNVWQIVTAIGFLIGSYGAVMRIYHLLDRRLSLLEQSFLVHAGTLVDHGARLQRYEDGLFKIVGDLQRLIGRVEVAWAEPHQHKRASDT